jgi:hypothetical protein
MDFFDLSPTDRQALDNQEDGLDPLVFGSILQEPYEFRQGNVVSP